jgi:hypothetical protein
LFVSSACDCPALDALPNSGFLSSFRAVKEKTTDILVAPTAHPALPVDFYRLSGSRKLDAILSVPEARSFVESLSSDELYMLIYDIGRDDCVELVSLASANQCRELIDLDCWAGDSLDVAEFDEWVELILTGAPDRLSSILARLDPELLADYIMMRTQIIFDRTQEDAIDLYQGNGDVMWSPDGEYALLLHAGDEESARCVQRVLRHLYKHDLGLARDILRTAVIGLRTENEELAYRFRRGRLADLGFPLPEDAHVLYADINVQAVKTQLDKHVISRSLRDRTPVSWALEQVSSKKNFLDECRSGMANSNIFVQEFAYCVNRALVAMPGGLSLRDNKRVQSIAENVYATLSLGLEFLSDGIVSHGVGVLEKLAVMQLFQVGHALTVKRAVRARTLYARGEGLFDEPLSALISALKRRPQPCFSTRAGHWESFKKVDQLDQADALFAQGEEMCDLFEVHLGFSLDRYTAHVFSGLSDAEKTLITFDTLARTLLAHTALGSDPSFEPLEPNVLPRLLEVVGELEDVAIRIASEMGEKASAILREAAKQLAQEFSCFSVENPPHAQYLCGILLVREDTD